MRGRNLYHCFSKQAKENVKIDLLFLRLRLGVIHMGRNTAKKEEKRIKEVEFKIPPLVRLKHNLHQVNLLQPRSWTTWGGIFSDMLYILIFNRIRDTYCDWGKMNKVEVEEREFSICSALGYHSLLIFFT